MQTQLFPDVSISAPATRSGLIASNISYPITISNNGSYLASNVTMTVRLPAGLQYQGGPAYCTESPAGSLTCRIPGSLPVSNSTTVNIVLQPVGPGPYTINSTVSSPDDSVASNNGPVSGIITVRRTCDVYTSTGDPYDCGTGYSTRDTAGNLEANQESCCVSVKIWTWECY